MGFVLDLEEVVPRQLKSAPGATVYVKPCTIAEYGEVLALAPPEYVAPAELEAWLETMERHVDHVSGLRVRLRPGAPVPPGMRAEERDGRQVVEVRGIRDALAVCPTGIVLDLIRAVMDASNLTQAQAGESVRPSSGAGSTAADSTAPTVDGED